MTLNHIFKVVELIFKEKLNCLEGYFRKQTGRTSVRNDSLSINLLVCWAKICQQRFLSKKNFFQNLDADYP